MDKLSTDNLEWQSLYWIAQPQFQTQTHYRRLNINANVMLETTFFSTVQINDHRPPQYISRCRIYLWLFAFTRFLRKIPLCINELDMAGHVWCDECYLVDWLLLHGFIPHPLQISSPNAGEGAHGLNTHLQLLKSYYNPVQNSWDANAIAIV